MLEDDQKLIYFLEGKGDDSFKRIEGIKENLSLGFSYNLHAFIRMLINLEGRVINLGTDARKSVISHA